MNEIINQIFEKERALYNLKNTKIINCKFIGKEDGESVLKETGNIIVDLCYFSLRYPLWHVNKFELNASNFDELARAPIWYSKNGTISDCNISAIKAVRECNKIKINFSKINSQEFGWKSIDIKISNSTINSEYAFLDSKKIEINNLNFKGKYSFQYVKDLNIINSNLDTKDAFWHSENVMVKDSTIKGEYLAWYSKNVTMINCKIIGTQPFCYCENLKLINCQMIDTDLAFEYSSVDAQIIGSILSIKNPKSGIIIADSIDKIINEDSILECECEIKTRKED